MNLTDNITPKQLFDLADDDYVFHGTDYGIDGTVEALTSAMERIWLEGMHDDEVGSVIENGLHVFRVAQWTMETDSQGFFQLYQHDSCEQAEQYMESRI